MKALILTGGKSSRMGSDKASLKIGNQTLLERTISLISPLTKEIYLSVAHDGFVVIQKRLRICQLELDHARIQPSVLFTQDSIATDKGRLVLFHSKPKSCLQHVILAGDVVAKVTETLFDTAGVHHVHPAQF